MTAGGGEALRVDVTSTVTEQDAATLWPAYDAIFGDVDSEAAWRENTWDRHASRDGFRLARAWEGERVVGFGYGYTGEHGQWWTDRAALVLEPEVADEWLGGHFELVSIGVRREARTRGIGERLLRALTDHLPHERWLLMTSADADDPARRLYAREGWRVLGPGIGEDRVILGRLRTSAR